MAKAMPVIVSLENFFSKWPSAVVVWRLSVSTSCFSDLYVSMFIILMSLVGEIDSLSYDQVETLEKALSTETQPWSSPLAFAKPQNSPKDTYSFRAQNAGLALRDTSSGQDESNNEPQVRQSTTRQRCMYIDSEFSLLQCIAGRPTFSITLFLASCGEAFASRQIRLYPGDLDQGVAFLHTRDRNKHMGAAVYTNHTMGFGAESYSHEARPVLSMCPDGGVTL